MKNLPRVMHLGVGGSGDTQVWAGSLASPP